MAQDTFTVTINDRTKTSNWLMSCFSLKMVASSSFRNLVYISSFKGCFLDQLEINKERNVKYILENLLF